MGSGCSQNNNTVGKCVGEPVSSNCVIWAGDAIPWLGICQGDTLTEVEMSIIEKLQDFASGEGITLSSLSVSCEDLNNKLQQTDKSLYSVLKVIYEDNCSLRQAITELNVKLDDLALVVDLKCFPSTVKTRKDFDQELINKICDLQNQITNIQNQIPTDIPTTVVDTVVDMFESCNGGIKITGTGSNRKINFSGIIPVGGRIFGDFDLSKFDSSGLGTGVYCGLALCNGYNGTPDMRDTVPGMASNIPGIPRTFTNTTNVGTRKGENDVTLLVGQIPDHTHNTSVSTIENPHRHNITASTQNDSGKSLGGAGAVPGVNPAGTEPGGYTDYEKTNLSVSVTVSGVKGTTGQSHNNIQPTYYAVWVQRIA